MSKESDSVEFNGVVSEVLAGSSFKVRVKNTDGTDGHEVLCYLGGKIRQNSIKIILHDEVKIAVSLYDPTRGRIIYRAK
jgi:translation initiation factor IF-1